MNDASSDSRNATAAAISDGLPRRFIICRPSIIFRCASDPASRRSHAPRAAWPSRRAGSAFAADAVRRVLDRDRAHDRADGRLRDGVDADLRERARVEDRAGADDRAALATRHEVVDGVLADQEDALALTAMARSNHSSGVSASSSGGVSMPALACTTSSLPNCSTIAFTVLSTSSPCDTSVRMKATCSCSPATRAPPSSSMSAMTTWAPSEASRSATACPIPLAPPVTSPTLPSNRPMERSFVVSGGDARRSRPPPAAAGEEAPRGAPEPSAKPPAPGPGTPRRRAPTARPARAGRSSRWS